MGFETMKGKKLLIFETIEECKTWINHKNMEPCCLGYGETGRPDLSVRALVGDQKRYVVLVKFLMKDYITPDELMYVDDKGKCWTKEIEDDDEETICEDKEQVHEEQVHE